MALSENQPGEVPDDERLRLYIKVPLEREEEEVKAHFKGTDKHEALSRSLIIYFDSGINNMCLISPFSAFGNVEYFNIPKDRVTGKSKGFGYVKVRAVGGLGFLSVLFIMDGDYFSIFSTPARLLIRPFFFRKYWT